MWVKLDRSRKRILLSQVKCTGINIQFLCFVKPIDITSKQSPGDSQLDNVNRNNFDYSYDCTRLQPVRDILSSVFLFGSSADARDTEREREGRGGIVRERERRVRGGEREGREKEGVEREREREMLFTTQHLSHLTRTNRKQT